MRGTVIESNPVPTGEYSVTITKIEDVEGQFGPQIRWGLEITDDGPLCGRTLAAWTAASLSTKSKLAKWSSACGKPFKAGAEFDSDALVGSEVTAVVLRKTRDDNGGDEYNKVEELKPKAVFDPFDKGAD